MMMFGKSGNHYSSFTRAAMVSMYLTEDEDMEGETSSQYNSANDGEDKVDDDDFGMEE